MGIDTIQGKKFQDAYEALGNAAEALRNARHESVAEAKEQLGKAGDQALTAGAHLGGAIANAGAAGYHTLESVVYGLDSALYTAEAALRAVGATGTAAAGAVAVPIEGLGSATRWAFQKMAQGLLAISNAIGRLFGYQDRHQMITSVLGDPNGKRLSEKLFESAGDQYQLAATAAGFAWESFTDAAAALAETYGHAVGSFGNVAAFAVHTGATLGHLGLAAVYASAPAVVALAELGVRASQVAVEYADKGVDLSRDAMVLAAEILTKAGNALAHPDQDIKAIQKFTAEAEAKLASIQKAA